AGERCGGCLSGTARPADGGARGQGGGELRRDLGRGEEKPHLERVDQEDARVSQSFSTPGISAAQGSEGRFQQRDSLSNRPGRSGWRAEAEPFKRKPGKRGPGMRAALILSAASLALACATTSPKQASAPAAQSATSPPPASPPSGGPGSDRDTRSTFERGLSEVSEGDLSAAERSFKLVLDRDPKLGPALAHLRVGDERRLLPEQAEEADLKATEISPSSGVAWEYLSRLYCRTGRAAKIEQRLTAQLQKFPQASELRMDLAYVLLEQGKVEAAGLEAKKVLEAEERNTRAMQL